MVKPSSLGFLEVSTGAAVAARSATAADAFTEAADSETLRRAPAAGSDTSSRVSLRQDAKRWVYHTQQEGVAQCRLSAGRWGETMLCHALRRRRALIYCLHDFKEQSQDVIT